MRLRLEDWGYRREQAWWCPVFTNIAKQVRVLQPEQLQKLSSAMFLVLFDR